MRTRLIAAALAAWMTALPAQAGALAVVADASVDAAQALKLHVPSPDWRDQIVYFLMIDRFDDGDPSNNDQGAGEYDPADHRRYSGGDLRGVARRIGYIRELGATAVWITPPVANRWWDPLSNYGGYHGYWAEDFEAVDAHYGDLDDYRRLSHALHEAGMYLVQDVVVNHTANFFSYGGDWREDDPAHGFRRIADSAGRKAPRGAPFDMNDARDPVQRQAGVYHWTPAIRDFGERRQELDFQLADLDDLNTGNPVVRRALREAYGHWIREVGVDAFRIDTAFYVPPEYFDDFMHADDADAPGMVEVARRTGRSDFLAFGEGFAIDRPFDEAQMRRIDGYMRGGDGRALLPSMLQFPLYGTLNDVFARGAPTAQLGHRIAATMRMHARPHLMPSFVDNHDVDRFLAGGSVEALKQSLLLIMTLPGIPTVYYGTEQGFTGQRAAMFAGGYGSGGRDRFDAQAPLYRYLQQATALRRTHRLFSRGTPSVLRDDGAGPGVLAYRMDHEGETALVVFNTGDGARLMDALPTGLAPGTRLRGAFSIDGDSVDAAVDADGRLTRVLPARSGLVWIAAATAPEERARAIASRPTMDPLAAMPLRGDFEVSGRAAPGASLQLVVDGDIARAVRVRTDDAGRWRATVATRDMLDAAVVHRLVAWDAARDVASAAREFRVEQPWTLLADHEDPAHDDHGPDGRYAYPTDPGWRDHRPLDIRGVRAYGAGGALKLELRMSRLLTLWNPANGFDHAAFTVFLGLPDRAGGSTLMPLQNASLPEGMRWHYRLRMHGWSNALFSWHGADARNEGRVASPSASVRADAARGTLTLIFPAGALGHPESLSGLKIYVNAWDYDGRYRSLSPQAQPYGFGGGDGERDPLVMDDTRVIVVP